MTAICVAPTMSTVVRNPARRQDWSYVQAAFEECEEDAMAVLERTARSPALQGLKVKTEFDRGSPIRRILGLCRSAKPDLVILGSHGHTGPERFTLGSVAEGVKHHVKSSILIAKNDPPPDRIVAGTDGSRPATRAVRMALRLGSLFDCPTSVLHSHEMAAVPEGRTVRDYWEQAMAGVQAEYPLEVKKGRVELHLTHGRAAKALSELADRKNAGLVVVGSRGLGGLSSTVLGSVSDKLTHTAKQSVLVVKET